MVRCFEDNDIIHVNGKVDPTSDIDVINLELIFCDLDQIGKRIDRLNKGKAKDSQSKVKVNQLLLNHFISFNNPLSLVSCYVM